MRHSIVMLFMAATVGWLGATDALAVDLSSTVDIHIAAQPLASALLEFSAQTQIQIMTVGADVRNLRTSGVSGRMPAREALAKLLVGSGLVYKLMGDSTVGLVREADVKGGPGPSSSTGAAEGADQSVSEHRPAGLEEIIVTAQKREERLQDVPVPVTVISADALINNHELRLQDYYTTIPGLAYVPGDYGGAFLAIRGITPVGGGNPTVGVMIDDVPYGASTVLEGGGFYIPDLDPSDLERVEVLRGPQGTLYGASSMGGLLKYVTVDPSTEAVSGRIQEDLSSVYNGGPGYGVRGAINVPLSDTLAIRASGFVRRDPGYIDNIQAGQNGINWANVDGEHLAALWRPSDGLSVKLSALLQNSTTHGYPEIDVGPGLGDLQQSHLIGSGWSHYSTQAYSAIVKAKVGSGELTSLTGYNINTFSSSFDYSFVFPSDTQRLFGTPGANLLTHTDTKKFTQELRLALPIGNTFEWLVGGFYTHEYAPTDQPVNAESVATGVFAGEFASFDYWNTYEEYAAFTNLTVHFTDRFDLQLGGRESHNHQSYREIDSGPYVPEYELAPSPNMYPRIDSEQSVFTYLVTPQFKASKDLMLYARIASGYRPGGPNGVDAAPGLPLTYRTDRTVNYEIGIKGDALDRVVTYDASLYYIDWKDIQLGFINSTTELYYLGNGGRAKSEGVELSAEARPVQGLTVAGWVSWDDAALTQNFPSNQYATAANYGVAGDRLPFSSRFSGSLSAENDFPLTANFTGFVGGVVSYTGARLGNFIGTPMRQEYPAYARTDLRAGAKYRAWTANLFVNNATDKRGLLTGGVGSANPSSFTIIQPRTIGLSVSTTF